jgi:flavorubredoxin
MKTKVLQATKHILEDNLEILKEPYNQNKVVLVYDKDSKLSSLISDAYIQNLKNYQNLDIEIIDFNKIDKNYLKEKLVNLAKNSTVILVQSTNFRLEDFRIRVTLHKA